MINMLKQGSVSLQTRKMIATAVIPESALAQEGDMMTLTHVETKQHTRQIMGTNTSKPWVISSCNNNLSNASQSKKLLTSQSISIDKL